MNTMNYKGYSARIEFDDEDEIFFGRVLGIRDGVHFHGETVEKLKSAFHESVIGYIEVCAKLGKSPQKPYSGQIMVRVDPLVHARSAQAAEQAGVSLAKWAEEKLRAAADRDLERT